jgi:hypothetical protein
MYFGIAVVTIVNLLTIAITVGVCTWRWRGRRFTGIPAKSCIGLNQTVAVLGIESSVTQIFGRAFQRCSDIIRGCGDARRNQ